MIDVQAVLTVNVTFSNLVFACYDQNLVELTILYVQNLAPFMYLQFCLITVVIPALLYAVPILQQNPLDGASRSLT